MPRNQQSDGEQEPEQYVILHSAVGRHAAGEIVGVSDGYGEFALRRAELPRLLALGAIAPVGSRAAETAPAVNEDLATGLHAQAQTIENSAAALAADKGQPAAQG